jgi:ABC-type branched-subunit amino acid transport system ATPase component
VLSLGDQRRLEIARAIVSRPKLILLDEPVSGFSGQEAERLLALLKGLNRERNVTMLVVEHDIGFLVSLCDLLSMMAFEIWRAALYAQLHLDPYLNSLPE